MIKLKRVSRIYDSQTQQSVEALLGIDLEIKEAEIVIVVGESGAGKSTLLNIIGLIDRDYSGEYELDGYELKAFSASEFATLRNEYFGFVFQDYALIEDESVLENIIVPLMYSKKFKRNSWGKRVEAALRIVRMESLTNRKVKHLSGGQRQRVAIARALINSPRILLMDEPTGSLNRDMSQEIMADIYAEVKKAGMTLIIVTHDLDKVKQSDARIIAMDMCKIVSEVT